MLWLGLEKCFVVMGRKVPGGQDSEENVKARPLRFVL
jgi:hypothetical protein